MGKAKKTTKGAEIGPPKCACDDAYKCSCGNRPPRPSKGHKWDPEKQEWGGKGHKQKGASGQIASVAQQAKTTEVGKTKVAQWQRLPSQLLQDVCKTQKRPPPKFKNLESKEGSYKYRVIVPHQKQQEKDLFFVPANPVPNEEQAKEESALLALLHLTPNLPHERKLPDPYRETWLHAVEQSKISAKVTTAKQNNTVKDDNNGSAAKASTNLAMANSYTSLAERRKKDEEKRRERNDRIRRHEAIRMANQNHPVFMSAKIREEIRRILRGETVNIDEDLDEDAEEPVSGDIGEVQAYVEERLHNEGFTKRQARAAFNESGVTRDGTNENLWDAIYEKCLQWLLLHLNEDQLPVGFDPRGGTLDVIANSTIVDDNETMEFAKKFGLQILDARKVLERASKASISKEDALWLSAQDVGKVSTTSDPLISESNGEVLQEEIEALEAIFASDCSITNLDEEVIIDIHLADFSLNLEIIVDRRRYPYTWPRRILVRGSWPETFGAPVHVELCKFLHDLAVGEPMVFEIQNHLLKLLQESPQSATVTFAAPNPSPTVLRQTSTNAQGESGKSSAKTRAQSKFAAYTKRPRERAPFWSIVSDQTPAAIAFPGIDTALRKARESLPAYAARDEFLATMQKAQNTGRVVLVTGETGCGKTTQIPQFILEESPAHAKIVVAQPRRLAATGVAGRVALERGEERPGIDSVGYVVRGDSAISKNSRLVFCTTGVLLRQMQNERALDCITHIVVDEVHERHLDTDVLLGLLKHILPKQKNLRVILMSATLAAERFVAYWGKSTPTMHIPGRTFPVRDFMLEDVLALTGYVPPKRKGKKEQKSQHIPVANSGGDEGLFESGDSTPEGDHKLQDLVARIDETRVDYDLLAILVKHLVVHKQPADDGSILVFLPGAPEINNAMSTIRRVTKDLPVWLLELHGGLQPKDQNLVFRRAEKGFTKIILSTNVAETSVTIPDCSIVIDSAREKQSSYDPSNRMPLLVETFASKASLKQRRGRAGRVREGTCYKLISAGTYQTLKDHTDPEIIRCALDQMLLSLLFLGVETGSGAFLRTLLDAPNPASIYSAAYTLEKLGAVKKADANGGLSLTPLGLHLAGIPAPPAVGKMLVMGSILGCRDAALAMAAGMSLSRSPFLKIELPRYPESDIDSQIQYTKQAQILEERSKLLQLVGNSDHALVAAIFSNWRSKATSAGHRKQYCDSLGLSFNGMRDMLQLAMQLDSALSAVGFLPSNEANRNSSSWRVIRSCAVAALSPTQVVKLVRPAEKYQETAEGVKQKNADAKENRFFVRIGNDIATEEPTKASEERVFLHPTSAIFRTGSFSCPWLVYHSLVRTSKPFLRDATECTAYALLLFGGSIAVQAAKGVIVIDDWARLSANPTIGTLVGKLREKIDELLEKKISDVTFDLAGTNEMKVICKLIKTDGLGS